MIHESHHIWNSVAKTFFYLYFYSSFSWVETFSVIKDQWTPGDLFFYCSFCHKLKVNHVLCSCLQFLFWIFDCPDMMLSSLAFVGKWCSMHVWVSFVQLRSPLLCCGETCKCNWWMEVVSIFVPVWWFMLSTVSFYDYVKGLKIDYIGTECLNTLIISSLFNSLRQDLLDLAKPDIETAHKLIIASRLATLYDCLLPSLGRK